MGQKEDVYKISDVDELFEACKANAEPELIHKARRVFFFFRTLAERTVFFVKMMTELTQTYEMIYDIKYNSMRLYGTEEMKVVKKAMVQFRKIIALELANKDFILICKDVFDSVRSDCLEAF